MAEFWTTFREFAEFSLFRLGEQDITPLRLLVFLVGIVVLRIATKLIRRFVEGSLTRFESDRASARSAARLAEIILSLVGFIVILQVAGVPITGFVAVFAALGIGIGLGLQGLVNNIVSGVIVLMERPIRPGDFIEVGDVMGTVLDIGLRATRIRHNDGREIIVPNSQILEQNVINWTSTEAQPLVGLEFGVHYNSNPEQVRDIALAVAKADARVLKKPEPLVRFANFGDSSLDFRLFIGVTSPTERFGILSDLRFALFKAFKAADIEIPYPQRDLHVRSSSVPFTDRQT